MINILYVKYLFWTAVSGDRLQSHICELYTYIAITILCSSNPVKLPSDSKDALILFYIIAVMLNNHAIQDWNQQIARYRPTC